MDTITLCYSEYREKVFMVWGRLREHPLRAKIEDLRMHRKTHTGRDVISPTLWTLRADVNVDDLPPLDELRKTITSWIEEYNES